MSGKLLSDPLFVGLTRPAMILGVSIKYFMLNLIISMLLFIQSNSLMNLVVAALLHLVGYVICFKEPRFIELFLNKTSKCGKCPNRLFYGANSYGI